MNKIINFLYQSASLLLTCRSISYSNFLKQGPSRFKVLSVHLYRLRREVRAYMYLYIYV